jgi:hypothetical protein
MVRLGLVLSGFLIACGGGGDSPEDKCEALLDNICDRVVDCELADSHDECIDALADSNDCSEAEEVGDSYGECRKDIDDASCAELFPSSGGQVRLTLPSSCSGAIE